MFLLPPTLLIICSQAFLTPKFFLKHFNSFTHYKRHKPFCLSNIWVFILFIFIPVKREISSLSMKCVFLSTPLKRGTNITICVSKSFICLQTSHLLNKNPTLPNFTFRENLYWKIRNGLQHTTFTIHLKTIITNERSEPTRKLMNTRNSSKHILLKDHTRFFKFLKCVKGWRCQVLSQSQFYNPTLILESPKKTYTI